MATLTLVHCSLQEKSFTLSECDRCESLQSELNGLKNLHVDECVFQDLPFGVTVSTMCDIGDPWTSGGFLTEHV